MRGVEPWLVSGAGTERSPPPPGQKLGGRKSVVLEQLAAQHASDAEDSGAKQHNAARLRSRRPAVG